MSNTFRILDAALNRAGEGLRVVEDFVRFVLDDYYLMGQVKQLRHDLAEAAALLPAAELHAARDTLADVGSTVSTDAEGLRDDAWDVCTASLKRAEQSLRSLEEFGKLVDADFAGRCESLRYRLYTLEKAIGIGQASRELLEGVRLCVLVDGGESSATFEAMVKVLVSAGVGMIQLRDKHIDNRTLIERGRLLVSIAHRQPLALPGVGASFEREPTLPPAEPGAAGRTWRRTLVVINDRADVAAVVNADGVHVGQEDLTVKDARAIVGPRALVGVSTHNIAQVRAAVLDGANYLGAGPTFASRTKAFDAFAGLEFLREIAGETGLPTFAIGGINADNLPSVLEAGIPRVAVSGAVTKAADPALSARRLQGILNRPVRSSAVSSLTPEP